MPAPTVALLRSGLRRLETGRTEGSTERGRIAAETVLAWVRLARARRGNSRPPWGPRDLHAYPPRGEGSLARASIERLLADLILARPSTAATLYLANENFLALEALAARSPSFTRRAVASTVERASRRYLRSCLRSSPAVRRSGSRVVRTGGRIVTFCPGRLVEEVLRYARRRRKRMEVVLSEGRPSLAGTAAAERLARAGIPVGLCADAALSHHLDGAAMLLLSADAISRDGAIGAPGAAALAELAVARRIPVIVTAGSECHLPCALAAFIREGEQPAGPAAARRVRGLRCVSRPFDLIPFDLIHRFLTPWGLLAREEAAALLGDMRCSPRLLRALVGRLGRPSPHVRSRHRLGRPGRAKETRRGARGRRAARARPR